MVVSFTFIGLLAIIPGVTYLAHLLMRFLLQHEIPRPEFLKVIHLFFAMLNWLLFYLLPPFLWIGLVVAGVATSAAGVLAAQQRKDRFVAALAVMAALGIAAVYVFYLAPQAYSH